MGILDFFKKSSELDDATKRSIYAEFKKTYESEMKTGRDKVFANLRVLPGQDQFFAMGAASQQFAQTEAKLIRKSCMHQTASKFNLSLRQVETVVSEGYKEKW
jgi:hypothetical protein